MEKEIIVSKKIKRNKQEESNDIVRGFLRIKWIYDKIYNIGILGGIYMAICYDRLWKLLIDKK